MTDSTARPSASRGMLRVGACVVLGALAGVAAKWVDDSPTRWLSDLGNYPGLWIFAIAAIGGLSRTLPEAVLRSVAFFVAMSLAYYGWSAYVLDISAWRYWLVWTTLAITVVPLMSALVNVACRRRGILPGLLLAAVAGVPLADGAISQLWTHHALGAMPPGTPLHPVQAAVNLTAALVIAGAFPRHHVTRVWALALTVPAAWVIGTLVVDRAWMYLR